MKRRTDNPAWQQLQRHFELHQTATDRNCFSIEAPGLTCDYSHHRISRETLDLLFSLADQCTLQAAISRLFQGDIVNVSEQRPALHPALRDPHTNNTEIKTTLRQMRMMVEQLNNEKITDILHVGIGGSHLGTAAVDAALRDVLDAPLPVRCHFIANQNQVSLQRCLSQCDPKTTLVILVSKSFTTAEMLVHANIIRAKGFNRCYAVTAQLDRAREFGVLPERILKIPDTVGGRFSLWSAVSLSLAISFGWETFKALLSGASAMDHHFQTSPWSSNLPVILALLGVWYRNFYRAETQAIIPYHYGLRYLPAHLQQLHMESLGKRVTQAGESIDYETGAIIWGGVGPGSQHSFQQLLLQGRPLCPIDFIVSREDADRLQQCMTQSKVLMQGNVSETPMKSLPGNCPSTVLVMDRLNAFSLGALLAMYEHKVFVQSVIWDINAFDQWGVESGKRLAEALL